MADKKPPTPPVDENPLDDLFKDILTYIKRQNDHKEPPSFFIVYAHDNESLSQYPANSEVVTKMITWFREAGCNVRSDERKEKQITDIQFCLLPYRDYPHDSVQIVILCGSKLLGRYMDDDRYQEFCDKVVQTYTDVPAPAEEKEEMRDSIQKLQKEYETKMGDKFHHVLTEIALVKTRDLTKFKPSIILFQLNGKPEESLPDYLIAGNDYLRTELSDASNAGEQYLCFLEMLEKLGEYERRQTGTADLVRDLTYVFVQAEKSLAKGQVAQLRVWRNELGEAWLKWTKSHVPSRKIDDPGIRAALRRYTSSLSIRTLLNKEFPINQHSIVLQVTDPSRPEKTETISTAQIFDERRLKQGQKRKPKRILIQGRPGTGKTTLCCQILNRMDSEPWNRFHWVLWVPLGKLVREKDLATFLGKVYFEEHYGLAKDLKQLIFNQDKDKTLLILDGWDEIHGASPEVFVRVQQLADFENVIITSRTHFDNMPSIDLILDSIGFSDLAMYEYVNNHALGYSNEIKFFLAKSQAVKEMLRAPMLLDSLCSFWHKLNLGVLKDTQPPNLPTVTMLYQTMVTELWRKDLSAFVNQPNDRNHASLLSKYYLDEEIKPESQCLGSIAVYLFDQRKSAIDRTTIDKIAEGKDQQGKHKWLAPNLTKTSFLHRDDSSREPTYSFVHLTFQEFFAAQSLVADPLALRSSIQRNKYDPRFAIVFGFVAGLLQNSETDTQLENLFELVEAEPQDLLGPAHQRLVMQCLSQVQRPRLTEMREILEYRMKNWLLFECEWRDHPELVTQLEFPDHIRTIVLDDQTVKEDIKRKILVVFRAKAALSPGIQSLMASWLQGSKFSSTLKLALLKTCGVDISIPTGVLPVLQELLKDKDVDVDFRKVADRFIKLAPFLPRTIFDIENSRRITQATGGYAFFSPADKLLGHESPQLQEELLCDEAERDLGTLRKAEKNAKRLGRLPPNLSLEKLVALRADLENDDPNVKAQAIVTLQGQPNLPSGIVFNLMKLIDHPNKFVSYLSGECLCEIQCFAEDVFEPLITLLSSTSVEPRKKILALQIVRRKAVPSKVHVALVSAMRDQDERVRSTAALILTEQHSLSFIIIISIHSLLRNKNDDVKRNAAWVLGLRGALHMVLKDAFLKDAVLRDVASQVAIMFTWQIRYLGRRKNLHDDIVQAIKSRMATDSDLNFHASAIEVLGKQQMLPPDVLRAIAAEVNIPSNEIRHAVAGAISQHLKAAIAAALREKTPQFFNDLYNITLWISFSKPLAWSFNGENKFCENMVPQGVDDGIRYDEMLDAIRQAKKALKLAPPPVSRRLE